MAFDLLDLMPEDTPGYLAPAWVSFVLWASAQPEMLDQFERETGMRYKAPESPLEAAVDEATGYGEEIAKRFILWLNVKHWGPIEGKQ